MTSLWASGLGRGKLVAKGLVGGLTRPVQVTAPPGDTDRLFIVEQADPSATGHIRIFRKSTSYLAPTPFLSLAGLNTGWEEGLVGLVFHPDYDTNGYFYVYFVANDAGTRKARIRRYTANGPVYSTAMTADAASGQDVLQIVEPHPGHNGGWMGFNPTATGADKYYLYLGVGDGGGGNDPSGNGQNKTTLLGKILRIDVGANGAADDFPGDANNNYAIPANNPLVGVGGGVREEIWAYGLRNPWRCGWDRVTGDFWITDVGQNRREEINFQPAADFTALNPVARNYGWRLREGTIATAGPVGGPPPADNVEPVFDYPHQGYPGPPATENGYFVDGDCISGGVPYRGRIKWLQGSFVFADFSLNKLYSFSYDPNSQAVSGTTLYTNLDEGFAIASGFADSFEGLCALCEGEDGEIYVCAYPQGGGETYGSIYVLTQMPYYLFRSTYFTISELNDPAISGAYVDADNDSLTTVEEFAMGTDPTVTDGASPLEVTVESAGAGYDYLTISLPRNPESFGYVDLQPRSGDLFTRSSNTAIITLDTPTEFKARDSSPANAPWSLSSRFMDVCFELLTTATEQP